MKEGKFTTLKRGILQLDPDQKLYGRPVWKKQISEDSYEKVFGQYLYFYGMQINISMNLEFSKMSPFRDYLDYCL